MVGSKRVRAWAEIVSAAFAGMAGVATAVYPGWFEALFETSPDAGSGAFEWVIAIALMLASVSLGLLARRDFRLGRTVRPVTDTGR